MTFFRRVWPNAGKPPSWSRWAAGALVCASLLVATLLLNTNRARADNLIAVTTTADGIADDGRCSLREAVRAANLDQPIGGCPAGNGADTIVLPANTYALTATGRFENEAVTGDLDITGTLTLQGAGAATTLIEANWVDRAFQIHSGAVRIEGLTIRHAGTSSDLSNDGCDAYCNHGGGILNQGALWIADSAITDGYVGGDYNTSFGGGIASTGALTITGSTIARDGANVAGGVWSRGPLWISDSTFLSNGAGPFEENLDGTAGALDASGETHISGSQFRDNHAVFNGGIVNAGSMTIESSIVEDNAADWGRAGYFCGSGGGITNQGTLTVTSTLIRRNHAYGAAGLNNGGPATIVDSSITDNVVHEGFFCFPGGTGINNGHPLLLQNTTVSGNRWNGIMNYSDMTLRNATIANNTGYGVYSSKPFTASNSLLAGNGTDCSGALVSQGYMLIQAADGCELTGGAGDQINVDPLLGPLADYGGGTLTHALYPGSPAIDRGNPAAPGSGGAACPLADQRGASRPADGDGDQTARCDIGAFETQPGSPPIPTLTPTPTPTPVTPTPEPTATSTTTPVTPSVEPTFAPTATPTPTSEPTPASGSPTPGTPTQPATAQPTPTSGTPTATAAPPAERVYVPFFVR